MLAWYATSVFYDPTRWPYKLERCVPGNLSAQLSREFRRRHNPLLDLKKVRQFGWWEWSEVLMRRLGRQAISDACNRLGNRAFCRQVIRLIEREPVDLLWGFNSSCLEVFQWAKKRGIRCVLDQTIGHPAAQNQVMLREQERHPEFFVGSYSPLDDAWTVRQNEEAAEADLVVVGSDFCARTMVENGCAEEKIRVVHYGYDESLFPKQQPKRNGNGAGPRPVRFLFAGEVGRWLGGSRFRRKRSRNTPTASTMLRRSLAVRFHGISPKPIVSSSRACLKVVPSSFMRQRAPAWASYKRTVAAMALDRGRTGTSCARSRWRS